MWDTWDIPIYPFWNHMDGPDLKSKIFLGYKINYLSIWPFMRHSCFSIEKVLKVAFFISHQKNSIENKAVAILLLKEEKYHFWGLFGGKQGWHIKGQMLR